MSPTRLLLFGYALSGAAALIYEVTWMRLLTLEMGRGVASTSTVLAAFMGGLAAGSAAGGYFARRISPSRALRLFATIETAIGALALLLPLELAAVGPLLTRAYADGEPSVAFNVLRVALSLLLLALPAAGMGATFPLASRWMVPSASHAAVDAGRLYAANTIGATAGAIMAGFALLPAIGLKHTTQIGVLLSLGSAALAYLAQRASNFRTENPTKPIRSRRKQTKHVRNMEQRSLTWIAAAVLALSGFASLTMQVVWTRLAALILGPTTYAFSVVVAVFIAGLAAGATLGSWLAGRTAQPILGLALTLLSALGLAAAATGGVDSALLFVAEMVTEDSGFGFLVARQALLVATLLVPMTVAFGAVFPFAVAVGMKTNERIASDLGILYALNTIGAVIGALLTGFVLIPSLGLHDTIRVMTIVVAASTFALVLIARERGRERGLAFVASAIVLFLGFAQPSWDTRLLSSGIYKDTGRSGTPDLETWLSAGRLLYYRDGATATVSVRESLGSRSLSLDGKVDASNQADMLTQRLLAHLPLLLHPRSDRVAILGLGSGVTLGAALKHPVRSVDVIEISPEVVEASRFFDSENHRGLADPRTRLIIGDGRLHLARSRSKYDVIVSEPSNPWISGIASLFTREFFELTRQRLVPGGVLCQWAHTYDMSDTDLRSIVATFLSVFPDGSLWLVGKGDVLLIGSTAPLEKQFGHVVERWKRAGVAADLMDVGIQQPFGLLSMFVAQREALARYAQGAPIQIDDRTQLEYSGPRSIFGAPTARNDDVLRQLAYTAPAPPQIRAVLDEADAVAWRNRGLMLLKSEVYESAWQDFARALERDPTDVQAYDGIIRASAPASTPGVRETLALLKRLAAKPGGTNATVALSRLLASTGAIEDATTLMTDLVQRHPEDVHVLDQLASVMSDMGNVDGLAPVVATMRRVAPADSRTHYYSASLYFLQGRLDLAAQEATLVVRKEPGHSRAQNLLGASLGSLGQLKTAREAFEAAVRANPLSARTYLNLAMLEVESHNREGAAQRYAEALVLDPTLEDARRGLAEVRVAR